eukprot:1265376-Pleurochrysis_carterae.AAC.1
MVSAAVRTRCAAGPAARERGAGASALLRCTGRYLAEMHPRAHDCTAAARARHAGTMAAMLESYLDKVVQVVTNDGRNIVGLLKGFDQTTNVILDECHERVFSMEAGVEQVLRSRDTVRRLRSSGCWWYLASTLYEGITCARRPNRDPGHAVVGEIDEDADAELDLATITAEPLKPVAH